MDLTISGHAVSSPLSFALSKDSHIFSGNPALVDAFQGCTAAIDQEGKPVITHKSQTVLVLTKFPAVCADEAKAYKPTGSMDITVSGDEIVLTNAPADVIDAFDG